MHRWPPADPRNRYLAVKVVKRGDRWMVWDGFEAGGYCDAAGVWTYRDGTDGWWEAHRFDLDEALEIARRAAPEMSIGGATARELAGRPA